MLIAPLGIILHLERDFHMKSHDDQEGFMALQNCLKLHHRACAETASILKMLDKSKPMSCLKSWLKIIFQHCLFGLVMPSALWFTDVFTDSVLCATYYHYWQIPQYSTSYFNNTLEYYPEQLNDKAKFFYSVFFIVLLSSSRPLKQSSGQAQDGQKKSMKM